MSKKLGPNHPTISTPNAQISGVRPATSIGDAGAIGVDPAFAPSRPSTLVDDGDRSAGVRRSSALLRAREGVVLLKPGDAIGAIACSHGVARESAEQLAETLKVFSSFGLQPVVASTLFAGADGKSGTGRARASELMRLYTDPAVRAIFDVSGGDCAEEVLPHLDFEAIKNSAKPLIGYSDLTVLLNAIYAKTGLPSYYFQARMIAASDGAAQRGRFSAQFMTPEPDFRTFDVQFLRGSKLEGVVIGGNLRCLLKLAGTEYLPRPEGKILFLEGYSGDPARIRTNLTRLRDLGYFNGLNGILLGTFTEMQQKQLRPSVEQILFEVLGDRALPVAQTLQLGHSENAHCVPIGLSTKLIA